jgi:HmuY protein
MQSFTRNTSPRFTRPLILLMILPIMSALIGCDSTTQIEAGDTLTDAITVSELAADPFVGFVEGRPVGTGAYSFYSLTENRVVQSKDSTTTVWDIALRGTSILVNGGLAGPGSGAIQIVDDLFDDVLVAPESGWAVDTEVAPATPPGSGMGWYNYNPATMVITPIPGKVILIRTATGKYAKMRILSYYKGMPDPPTAESEARFISFEYVFQGDGSRNFQK